MSYNQLTSRGLESISKYFRNHQVAFIKKLSFEGNLLERGGAVVRAIASILSHSSLKSLNLSNCCIGLAVEEYLSDPTLPSINSLFQGGGVPMHADMSRYDPMTR